MGRRKKLDLKCKCQPKNLPPNTELVYHLRQLISLPLITFMTVKKFTTFNKIKLV
jgi:hypothetical protein